MEGGMVHNTLANPTAHHTSSRMFHSPPHHPNPPNPNPPNPNPNQFLELGRVRGWGSLNQSFQSFVKFQFSIFNFKFQSL
jgi:hypothetical protein